MMLKWPSLARTLGVAALFLAAALAGTASGVIFAFVGDLPQISALDDYSPGTITRVLGRDGSVIGSFATERRQIVTYDQIPDVLRHAIMSAEDQHFMTHGGIEPTHMLWAYAQDKLTRRRTPGRSTITQQLARQLFPIGFDRTPERKIKEALVALQIEKRYTKQEIFTMYCNKVAWGFGTYGVEAASELYFDKPAKDLTLNEAATIAGMLPAPQNLNPYSNIKASTRRRNYTLERMADDGYITRETAKATEAEPIVTHGQPSRPPSVAPYFLEVVRQQLDAKYGAKAVYENGLVVHTGLDPELQRAANRAVDDGARRIDKLHGWRKPARNLVDEKRDLDTWRDNRWRGDPKAGDVLPAIVTSIEGADIHVRVGTFSGVIGAKGYAWTRKRPAALVRRGDLVEIRVASIGTDASTLTGSIEQPPLVQGAALAIDNHTGQILAMVGGDDFEHSEFNRATQAMRQVGSLFKPFVYTAAIDRGYTTQSLLDDSPASFDVGPNQPPYEPQNYDREFLGDVTVRLALEDSRNVPTVRLMAALGPKEVIKYARDLGITTPLPEFLSVAIGAAESTLTQMVSAYSAFPNQGVRMTPLTVLDVVDRDGNTLEQHRVEPHEAIRADTAYILTDLLEGVIQHGTGAPAASIDWPLGGKTGTTDDYTDAWFVGFDPDITVGVWVGYDQKKPLGGRQTGTVAALPIWMDIMKSWVARRRADGSPRPEFTRPANIVTADTPTGSDVFIAGTEPGR
jgi:penicillin-binding protein 1A